MASSALRASRSLTVPSSGHCSAGGGAAHQSHVAKTVRAAWLKHCCTGNCNAAIRKHSKRKLTSTVPSFLGAQAERPSARPHQQQRGGFVPRCNAASGGVARSGTEQAETVPAAQSLGELRSQFCCPGVDFQEVAGLCLAVLRLADGSAVRVLLEGGRVIAWRAVMYHGGKEDLIYSKLNRTQAEGRGWLRGGIPVSFPLPAEGAAGAEGRDPASLGSLVRGMPWRVVSTWADGDAFAEIVLSLEDSPATRALWPHPFRLRYSVHQMPDRLVCVLRAHNPGPRAFSFAASLDSHLAVIDPAGAHVIGLNGVKYVARTQLNRNWKSAGLERQQDVPLGQAAERIYCRPQAAVSLFDRGGYRTITVEKEGFEDVVLVDPGSSNEESSFVCLGAGNHRIITLAPGESWEGRQTIRLEK